VQLHGPTIDLALKTPFDHNARGAQFALDFACLLEHDRRSLDASLYIPRQLDCAWEVELTCGTRADTQMRAATGPGRAA